jgi:anti-sigma regulatory factor (Ser/Thr protein kinase)
MVIWRFASNSARDALGVRNDFIASLQKHAGSFIDVNAAKVVFTELVANVVLHAPGPIAVTLEIADSHTILTVADTGRGFVFAPTLPCNPFSEGGRGLFLVSRFAVAVSVNRLDGAGTSVSAILPFTILPTSR